jgi:hypothetical protein
MLAAQNFYKGMILDDIQTKMAATEEAATIPPPEATTTPAAASATSFASTHVSELASASASTSASASASAMEQADRAEHDKVVLLDDPTSTQDAFSMLPNPSSKLCSICTPGL